MTFLCDVLVLNKLGPPHQYVDLSSKVKPGDIVLQRQYLLCYFLFF